MSNALECLFRASKFAESAIPDIGSLPRLDMVILGVKFVNFGLSFGQIKTK